MTSNLTILVKQVKDFGIPTIKKNVYKSRT